MKRGFRSLPSARPQAGLGLMEVIIGLLVCVILGSILIHVARLGYAMYELNATTNGVAHALERARDLAKHRNQQIRVVFKAKEGLYGVDRNGNGRLESAEMEELPEGVTITEDAEIVFTRTGTLNTGSKEPNIVISNNRDSRSVSISALGSVEID